ncbi:MAG: gamma-glutamyltransferase [Phycisphaerales bacterium]
MRLVRCVFAAVLCSSIWGCAAEPAATGHAPIVQSRALYSAVVAADHPDASAAGAKVLEQGGNAVDAAVAAAFTLSVVRPQSCGIGGGGFMVIHLPGAATRDGVPVTAAINGREWCPAGIRPDTFEKSIDTRASTVGGLAVAVPGTVAALLHAQEKFGRLDRRVVLQPAIDVARNGFVADRAYISAIDETLGEESKRGLDHSSAFFRQVLGAGTLRVGDRVVNPMQAQTLEKIATEGAAAFYQGEIADAIALAVQHSGGVLTREDLAEYARSGVVEMAPIGTSAFGRTFITMPPPSSGGVALSQVVGMLDILGVRPSTPEREAEYLHTLTEAFKLAFADRAAFMADPAFTPVPTSRLLSGEDIRDRARLIDPMRSYEPSRYVRSSVPETLAPDHGTSHVSVMDRWGGAVRCDGDGQPVLRVARRRRAVRLRAQQPDGRLHHSARQGQRVRAAAVGRQPARAKEAAAEQHDTDDRARRAGPRGGRGRSERRTANHHGDCAGAGERPAARRRCADGGFAAAGTPPVDARHALLGTVCRCDGGRAPAA